MYRKNKLTLGFHAVSYYEVGAPGNGVAKCTECESRLAKGERSLVVGHIETSPNKQFANFHRKFVCMKCAGKYLTKLAGDVGRLAADLAQVPETITLT